MSEDVLKFVRLGLFSMVTYLGGKSLYTWGIAGFPWFLSDWGVFTAIGTEFLLLWSHFRKYDPYYDSLVKAIYEITFPLQFLVTLLYWTAYYTPGLWVPSDFSTWLYPIFMHVVPVVTLTIESLFNSIVFDIQKGALRSLWWILSYIPLSYFSKDIAGYFPYSFIDWASWSSHAWIAAVIVLDQLFFYGVGYLNNYLKTGSGVSPKEFFSYHADEFKGLLKMAKF